MGVRPTVAATALHPFTPFGVRCPQEGDPVQQTTNDVLQPCGRCDPGPPPGRGIAYARVGGPCCRRTRRRRAVAVDDAGTSTAAVGADWPQLRVADWAATRDTLHMWTQVVGKIRLAKAPMLNHWWQTPLYVTPRGLTTSSIPDGRRLFDIELDFLDARDADPHQRRRLPRGRPGAQVRRGLLRRDDGRAARAGGGRRHPADARGGAAGAIPFAQDTEHASLRRRRRPRCSGGSSCRPTG